MDFCECCEIQHGWNLEEDGRGRQPGKGAGGDMAQQRPCTPSHSGFLKAEATLDSSQMSCPTLTDCILARFVQKSTRPSRGCWGVYDASAPRSGLRAPAGIPIPGPQQPTWGPEATTVSPLRTTLAIDRTLSVHERATQKRPWNTNQVGGLGLELEHASICPSNCSRLARSSSVVAKSVPSMLELLKVKMSLSC